MAFLNNMVFMLFAVIAVTGNSYAQTYTLTPGDTVIMAGLSGDFQTLSISESNITTDTIYLRWEKVSEEVPANWDASLCDNRFCYTTLMDSGMMNPVVPGDMGIVLLHITPYGNVDTSIIRYAVWDINAPALKDTLTFILTTSEVSSIGGNDSSTDVAISPIPASGQIYINAPLQAGFNYAISDLVGREIVTGYSEGNSQFVSIESVPNGIYILSLSDRHEITSTCKIIVQH
jgi:hypothetical protein